MSWIDDVQGPVRLTETREACAMCGMVPARGYAYVEEHRLCHGDEDPGPTCFELFTQARSLVRDHLLDLA